MKKILIFIGVIIASIIAIFAIYVTEESIRLSVNTGAKPFIMIDQTFCDPSCAELGKEVSLNYYGIGYKLSIRYYHAVESGNDVYRVTGEEFYLFNNIMLWAWVV